MVSFFKSGQQIRWTVEPLARHAGHAGRFERLAEQGTDFAVLYPNIALFPLHSNREELRRVLTRAINHYHADLYRPYADRLTPVAAIPLHTPQEGIEELEFAIRELGLKATIIPGAIRRPIKEVAAKYPPQHHREVARYAQWVDLYGLDSEHDYDPFWAKAAELGVPVVMHPGGADNIIKDGALRGRADLGNIIGNPLETTYFLSRLIFDGTLDKFPGLRVCAAHAGGYLPSYLGRSEVACEVRNNANCANKKKPSEYCRSGNIYFSCEADEWLLPQAVKLIGDNQIVYASDFPHWDHSWPASIDEIRQRGDLNDAQKQKILADNARRLYRL